MMQFLVKVLVSALVIAGASELARRYSVIGALLVSLPLTSILAMIWLWRDTHDPVRLAVHAEATFWFVLPSLPMFLLLPYMLRHEWPFWASLLAGSALTILLYLAMSWLGPRVGIRL